MIDQTGYSQVKSILLSRYCSPYGFALALAYWLCLCFVVSCAPPAATVPPLPTLAVGTITPPPTSPVTRPVPDATAAGPTALPPTAVVTLAPTVSRFSLGATAAAPPDLVSQLERFATTHADLFRWQGDTEADIVISLGSDPLVAQWVYAVVAPFATIQDEITSAELAEKWAAGVVLSSPATDRSWAGRWGAPEQAGHIRPAAELTTDLWSQRLAGNLPLGLVPFSELEPALKVLAVDGMSPLAPGINNESYPLTLSFAATGGDEALAAFLGRWGEPVSNRRNSRLTHVAMTGVTALTRATAFQMEVNGIEYPGQEVAVVLQSADIAHVSHEVSFSPNCPYPDPLGSTSFCARDSYFGLLEGLGIDVVELTGNHVNDYGRQNLVHTIELYEAAGMQIFGGGRDLAEAARPALFKHQGNNIAFVGCNPAGPNYAWATAEGAGSNPCFGTALEEQIAALRSEGYVVIATQQYPEHYDYRPTNSQRTDFRALVDAGAHVVSGSQGHHAMAFDLYAGGFIHYGPGNLFFDQMQMMGTRETFVDIYIIYEGRLLSVVLWTGLIENYARPRQMSPVERAATLGRVFAATQYQP